MYGHTSSDAGLGKNDPAEPCTLSLCKLLTNTLFSESRQEHEQGASHNYFIRS